MFAKQPDRYILLKVPSWVKDELQLLADLEEQPVSECASQLLTGYVIDHMHSLLTTSGATLQANSNTKTHEEPDQCPQRIRE